MKEKSPLVSIIMPAYNCEAFVEQAIASVLHQTYTNWELLVADDGSTDNTKAIIDAVEDNRVIKTHNETNQGNIRTRNRLSEEAGGEFITILDADDWIDKEKVRHQLNVFEVDKELNVCVTNYFKVSTTGDVAVNQNVECDFILDANEFELTPRFHPASIMLKKNVLDEVGGLNLYFDRLFGEDIYWIYLILERFRTLYIAQPLYYYRANPASLTNNINNKRKLTVISLIEELIRQRRQTGEDWLSRGTVEEAVNFEHRLLQEKKWLGERYRTIAAKYIDLLQLNQACKYLFKAVIANPYNTKNARTLLYLIKSALKSRNAVC